MARPRDYSHRCSVRLLYEASSQKRDNSALTLNDGYACGLRNKAQSNAWATSTQTTRCADRAHRRSRRHCAAAPPSSHRRGKAASLHSMSSRTNKISQPLQNLLLGSRAICAALCSLCQSRRRYLLVPALCDWRSRGPVRFNARLLRSSGTAIGAVRRRRGKTLRSVRSKRC